jgi:hypothetical protein
LDARSFAELSTTPRRAIVLCYDAPDVEAISLAKSLRIEFVSPEELVKSLSPSATE